MAHETHLRFKPKQSLGQNFLIDENIARKTVKEIHLDKDDIIIEVGSGLGSLTKYLAGKAKHLIAFEIDRRVVDELNDKFQSDDVEIIHQDFLDVSLIKWKNRFKTKLRIVGNIPYHLTSPILFKTFDEKDAIKDITIMVQREVAKRIVAKPNTKDYSILSVLSQFYGVPKLLFNVSPSCFYPKPKVISTVVTIALRATFHIPVNDRLFAMIVKTTFGKRRKTLRNSLSYLPIEKNKVDYLIKNIDFPLEKRPEQLTVDEFGRLTREVENILKYK